MELRPNRGGFLRPFGCGWFIREFLKGNAPEDSTRIDPDEGAIGIGVTPTRLCCNTYYRGGKSFTLMSLENEAKIKMKHPLKKREVLNQ